MHTEVVMPDLIIRPSGILKMKTITFTGHTCAAKLNNLSESRF